MDEYQIENMDKFKYLLYIDILGFSDIANSNYPIINKLFSVIDTLNAHNDPEFQTIVFSDTILIFSQVTPVTTKDHETHVMFCCEFAQDLTYKCKDLNIQFRAILTYEEFYYQKLSNIEAYHGKALINAYKKEKEITGIGLYIDKKIANRNKIFPSTSFDDDLNFVFLLKDFERFKDIKDSEFPIPSELIDHAYWGIGIKEAVQILKRIKDGIEMQNDSRIRSKYLQTYYFYKTRYKSLIEHLEKSDFDYTIISPQADWSKVESLLF